eukprot:gene8802-750_t
MGQVEAKEIPVILLGLQGVGKSNYLHCLKNGELTEAIPTLGFLREEIEYKDHLYQFWEIGGDSSLRDKWQDFFENKQAVIFMIDSSNLDTMEEAHNELQKLMKNDILKDLPFLILANKQDMENVMGISELNDLLELNDFEGLCAIKPCSNGYIIN